MYGELKEEGERIGRKHVILMMKPARLQGITDARKDPDHSATA